MLKKINNLIKPSKLTESLPDVDISSRGHGSELVVLNSSTDTMLSEFDEVMSIITGAVDRTIQRLYQVVNNRVSRWALNRKKTPCVVMTDGGQESYLLPHEERLSQLNTITQTTRANLIQNMLGHRWMMPSKSELDYYNQSKSAGTISGHLDKLIEADIAMRIVMPQGKGTRDGPSAFFTLTDEGYATLDYHALFIPDLDEIRSDHARVKKTDDIIEDENAHRPTILVEYDHPLKGDGRSVVDPCEYAADFDKWTKKASSEDCDDEEQEVLPGV